MQQRFCANLMNETDTDRPDQRRFFQDTFPKHLQHAPDSRKFSVSLRLAQGSIRSGIISEKLSFFTSEPACTQFVSLMLTVLFRRVQNHLPHTLQNQASTSRETGMFRHEKQEPPLRTAPALRLNGKNSPHLYKAVGISLPSSDAFLAEPSPAIRSRITSL